MEEHEVVHHNEAVYIAMQPEMEGQVEVQDCQEVVIVGEGGEENPAFAESFQIGGSHVVAVGAEEVYEESFVPLPKEEKPDFSELSQKLRFSSNRYSVPSYEFATTPTTVVVWTDMPNFSYTSPRSQYRPGRGKSLAKMRKVERMLSSEEGSEGSGDDYVPPVMVRHKKPKRREFAHRLQWRNRDMVEAMKGVEEQKMTIRGK